MVKSEKVNIVFWSCMSLNLDTMPLKLLPISREHGERDPQVIELYEGSSKKFVVEMRALRMRKVDDERTVLTTNI